MGCPTGLLKRLNNTVAAFSQSEGMTESEGEAGVSFMTRPQKAYGVISSMSYWLQRPAPGSMERGQTRV